MTHLWAHPNTANLPNKILKSLLQNSQFSIFPNVMSPSFIAGQSHQSMHQDRPSHIVSSIIERDLFQLVTICNQLIVCPLSYSEIVNLNRRRKVDISLPLYTFLAFSVLGAFSDSFLVIYNYIEDRPHTRFRFILLFLRYWKM